MTRSRRPRIAEERGVRVQRRFAPGSTVGAVSNAGRGAKVPRGRTGRSGGVNTYSLLPRHQFDLLKMEGEAPQSVYTLTRQPMAQWPHVVIGNVHAIPGVDYTRDGKKITMASPGRLATSDRMWATYDWLVDPPDPVYDYNFPTVIGIPYTWWDAGGSGGYRKTWLRIEGVDPAIHHMNLSWQGSLSGGEPTGGYDTAGGAGNFGRTALAGSPYGSTIYYEELLRPWYGAGEVQPGNVMVTVNRERSDQTVIYDGPTNWVGNSGPPPAGYDG